MYYFLLFCNYEKTIEIIYIKMIVSLFALIRNHFEMWTCKTFDCILNCLSLSLSHNARMQVSENLLPDIKFLIGLFKLQNRDQHRGHKTCISTIEQFPKWNTPINLIHRQRYNQKWPQGMFPISYKCIHKTGGKKLWKW